LTYLVIKQIILYRLQSGLTSISYYITSIFSYLIIVCIVLSFLQKLWKIYIFKLCTSFVKDITFYVANIVGLSAKK